MGRLAKGEQAAIEAVARRYSAGWEAADGATPDAYLTVEGRRVAVDVVAMEAGSAEPPAKPRLRFDRVALALVSRLKTALPSAAPDGEAVIFTVTAPIRLPAKTAEALEAMIKERLGKPSARWEFDATVCGNQVRARLVMGLPERAPKAVGFVHNPDPGSAEGLLNATESLLQHVGAAARRRPPEAFAGERWLVLASQAARSSIETYRQVYAQLSWPNGFARVLMAFADRRVEILTG